MRRERSRSHSKSPPPSEYSSASVDFTGRVVSTPTRKHHRETNHFNNSVAMEASQSTNAVVFRDHYSIGRSTELRFRGNKNQKLCLLDDVGRDQQLVLAVSEHQQIEDGGETTGTTTVIRPSVHPKGSFGTALLRGIATLVSFFVLTCWVAFAIQCLVFLFMNVVGTHTPSEWTAYPPIGSLLGCIAACPLLLDSLASLLTMSWACTVDCWRGIATHPTSLWKTNARLGTENGEWPTLVVFYGIPLLTCGITTLASAKTAGQSDTNGGDDVHRDWYETTMLVWAGSVWVFQMVYMEFCVAGELACCHDLLKHCKQTKTLWESVRANLLLTQRRKYSGIRRERYLVDNDPEGSYYRAASQRSTDKSHLQTSYSMDTTREPVQTRYHLGTRLTRLLPCIWDNLEACPSPLPPPKPLFEVEETPPNDDHPADEANAPDGNPDSPPNEEPAGEEAMEDGIEITKEASFEAYPPVVVSGPKRHYTIDEVFGNVTISTKSNWTLSRMWCVNRKRITTLTVFHGNARVTPCQFWSGYICSGLTMILIIIVLVGMLVWLGKSIRNTILVILFVLVVCFCPMVVSLYKVRQFQANKQAFVADADMGKEVVEDSSKPFDEDRTLEEEEDETIEDECKSSEVYISVWECVRVTELKEWACYAFFAIEIAVLFLWPVLSLFFTGNTNVAIVFLVLSIHWIPRHYFNSSSLLQEVGSLDDLDLSGVNLSPFARCASRRSGGKQTKNRDLKNKVVLSNIVRRVTKSKAKSNWIGMLAFFFFVIAIGYYTASNEEMFSYAMGRFKWKGVIYASDFYWDPQPRLAYPTCKVEKGFSVPGEGPASLADFAFLSSLAFSSPEEAQPLLDQWFGEGRVIDDYDFVTNYREITETIDHPVTYKLYTFPDSPTSGVVGIRGSEAMWDWMVDMQLWVGSVFAQAIKHINPLGQLWDPILDEVVYMINFVQSQDLKEVSYYQFTVKFIDDLYNGFGGRNYENLRVTGASLGGGLAILTGAISGAPAISFSGLNAMFSRRTFLPPITEEQLNTLTFNTIPQRDIIAAIDHPGMLHQRMQCIGPKNSLFACHSMFRSLCEIQYRCGSQGRPINCWCVQKYGYPEPTQNGTVSWNETCADAVDPP